MDNENPEFADILDTEEEEFVGLPSDRVPRLQFHHLMESDNPLVRYSKEQIDFSPLIKKTPFEKEKNFKGSFLDCQGFPTTQISNELSSVGECEVPLLLKVAFWDQLGSINRNSIQQRSEIGRTGAKDKFKTFPKGILKGDKKKRFQQIDLKRVDSNLQFNAKTVSTQATMTSGASKRSLFKRLNESMKMDTNIIDEGDSFTDSDLIVDKINSKGKRILSPYKIKSKKN